MSSLDSLTRRDFFNASSVALAGAALPLAGAEREGGTSSKLKIVCVGGHPDDPESGCAGTLIRYAAAGHAVTVIYLTRGERGIAKTSLEEAARTRSAESESACKIMGATPRFFGQIDGATEFSRKDVDSMSQLLLEEKPDIIFTHWPIDTHMDHQVASLLAMRASWTLRVRPAIYFFEVNSGSQTEGFAPNTYVDISEVAEKKKLALFAHESQDGRGIWRDHHEIIARWRGREAGVAMAEAFVRLNREIRQVKLPST